MRAATLFLTQGPGESGRPGVHSKGVNVGSRDKGFCREEQMQMPEDFKGLKSVVRLKGCELIPGKGQVATDPGLSFGGVKNSQRSNGYCMSLCTSLHPKCLDREIDRLMIRSHLILTTTLCPLGQEVEGICPGTHVYEAGLKPQWVTLEAML